MNYLVSHHDLKQGTIYILRYTSSAAANEAEIGVSFEAD